MGYIHHELLRGNSSIINKNSNISALWYKFEFLSVCLFVWDREPLFFKKTLINSEIFTFLFRFKVNYVEN